MEYLQYLHVDKGVKIYLYVLNLIINGIPSIRFSYTTIEQV